MTTISEHIAAKHWQDVITEQCACRGDAPYEDYGKHVAEIAEAMTRAQIATNIEDLGLDRDQANALIRDGYGADYVNGWDAAIIAAAQIVRNEP